LKLESEKEQKAAKTSKGGGGGFTTEFKKKRDQGNQKPFSFKEVWVGQTYYWGVLTFFQQKPARGEKPRSQKEKDRDVTAVKRTEKKENAL